MTTASLTFRERYYLKIIAGLVLALKRGHAKTNTDLTTITEAEAILDVTHYRGE